MLTKKLAKRLFSKRQPLYQARIKLFSKIDLIQKEKVGDMTFMSFWEAYKNKALISKPPYGIAKKEDFGDFDIVIANIFAYDNKHYYVYRAVSDSSKLAYLSRKQYYRLKAKLSTNFNEKERRRIERNFCERNGTMASPYKLFKGALIENKKMHVFYNKVFKVLDAHERTINNPGLAESLIKCLINGSSPLELEETDNIQRCYDLHLPDSYEFSDKRFCTHSCMEGSHVGGFYNSLPVKGVIIKNKNEDIGRFLLWDLPDGKQYVDRLYVRAAYCKSALMAIDLKYPDAIKYPSLTDKIENNGGLDGLTFYKIPIIDNAKFVNSERFPWIDTFAYLIREKSTNKYYLTNIRANDLLPDGERNRYIFVEPIRGWTPSEKYLCPDCGGIIVGKNDKTNYGYMHKILVCKNYKPDKKKESIYINIIKNHIKNIQETENGTKNKQEERFLSVFEL